MCNIFNCSMHFVESSENMYKGSEYDINEYGYYKLED